MKKIISAFLCVAILMITFSSEALASFENRVFSDEITVEAGNNITVPVKIENNKGFMGFAVTLTYDADVFIPISVSKASMLSGTLNDSIETSKNNSFKIIYSGTGDIKKDGVMFNVVLKVKGGKQGRYSLKLSYSKEDTFNEAWEDVKFNCEDIKVNVSLNGEIDKPSEEIKPSEEQKLSDRMKNWLEGLPDILRYVLSIFVWPVIIIVSVFE